MISTPSPFPNYTLDGVGGIPPLGCCFFLADVPIGEVNFYEAKCLLKNLDLQGVREKKNPRSHFLLIMAIICISLEYFVKSVTGGFYRGHFGFFFADTLYNARRVLLRRKFFIYLLPTPIAVGGFAYPFRGAHLALGPTTFYREKLETIPTKPKIYAKTPRRPRQSLNPTRPSQRNHGAPH